MPRNFRSLSSLLILFSYALWGPIFVHAGNYAFLVAVQDYDAKDLKRLNYTRGDIAEFAKVLQKSGFMRENITVLNDKPQQPRYTAEAAKIRTELDLVLGAIESGDTLIIAFSGHGVQFEGDEKNYYCPLDANLDDPKRATLIPLSEIYEKLKQCPAEKKLLLVDACRNDPLSAVKKSRATVNLKSVTRPQKEAVPKGVVALFSCSEGQESYEWPELKHGVFFNHVLEGWNGAAANSERQITLDGVVAYSKEKTQTFARLNLKALQTPQLKSDFVGTWVLRKLDGPIASESSPPRQPRTRTRKGTKPSTVVKPGAAVNSLSIELIGNNNTIVFRMAGANEVPDTGSKEMIGNDGSKEFAIFENQKVHLNIIGNGNSVSHPRSLRQKIQVETIGDNNSIVPK